MATGQIKRRSFKVQATIGEVQATTGTPEWISYIHTNGAILIKRYIHDKQREDMLESEFVKRVYGPYTASSRKEAYAKAVERFNLYQDEVLKPRIIPSFLGK